MKVQDPAQEQEGTKSGLVLDSLEIKNFRAFRHLTIEKLGRVNLITGKNNVGKSTLLEAMWLYARGGTQSTLRDLLDLRDELRLRNTDDEAQLDPRPRNTTNDRSQSANARFLVHGWKSVFGNVDPIVIGPREGIHDRLSLIFQWVSIVNEAIDSESDVIASRQIIPIRPEERFSVEDAQLYVYIYLNGELESRYRLERVFSRNGASTAAIDNNILRSQFVRAEGLVSSQVGIMWDAITATPLEDLVLDSLKLISPALQRIVFVTDQDRSSSRTPMVKMENLERMPLRSLGDGINHLFEIALALVTSRDGIFLIDEIDNGLHYMVLLDVWRFIFRLAAQLNVQIVATTHSWECIEAFQLAASESHETGVLVKLREIEGDVQAISFDEDELETITRQQIEVR